MAFPDRITTLLANATGAVTGPIIDISRLRGDQLIQIINTGSGTCQVVLQGSIDGLNYYPIRVTQEDVDPEVSPTNGVISVAANSAHIYIAQLIEHQMVVAVQNPSGAINVTVSMDSTETV